MQFRPMTETDRALSFTADDPWSRHYWSNRLWSLQHLGVAQAWVAAADQTVIAWFNLQPLSIRLEGVGEATSVVLSPKAVVSCGGLAVASAYRGSGLGRETLRCLLRQALDRLETEGGVGLLMQPPSTQASQWLYRSKAFEPLDAGQSRLFVSYASLRSWRKAGWLESL
ncbi:MAG: GNAT family N-acetyltransferase [Saccharospirillum sp.]